MTRATSGVTPSASVMTFSMPARTRRAGDSLADVAHEELDERIGLVDGAARARGTESRSEGRSGVYHPVRRDQVDRHAVGNLGDEAHVAAEARDGEVDHRPHPEAVQSGEAATAASTARCRIPLRVRQIRLELRVAHEDVLVDQGRRRGRPDAIGPRNESGRVPRPDLVVGDSVPAAPASARLGVVPPRESSRWRLRAPGPARGTRPGVRDSFGTTPGTRSGRSSRLVVHLHGHLAGQELGVRRDLGDAVDPADGHPVRPQRGDHLVGGPRPRVHAAIEASSSLARSDSSFVRGQGRIVASVFIAADDRNSVWNRPVVLAAMQTSDPSAQG